MSIPQEADKMNCRKCGAPVIFSQKVIHHGRTIGFSLDFDQVPKGAYLVTERVDGDWVATYIKVEERDGPGFRQHSCKPKSHSHRQVLFTPGGQR